MNHKTLTDALPIVAAAYGRKFNVPVEVGGDHACTDGTIIRIPQLAEDPTARTLAWGYLAHEAGHVRHTDFSVWNAVAGHPLTRAITNILEDVRIENAMIGSYPGARQTLDAVLDWMIAEGKIAAPSMESSPPTILVNALLVLARHRYRRQVTLASLARDSEHALRQVFPPSFVHRNEMAGALGGEIQHHLIARQPCKCVTAHLCLLASARPGDERARRRRP